MGSRWQSLSSSQDAVSFDQVSAPIRGIWPPRAAPFYGCQKCKASISGSERRFLIHRFRTYVEPEV